MKVRDYLFKHINIVCFIGFIFISFILYGNSIDGNFVYDDKVFVDVEEIRGPDGVWRSLTEPFLIPLTTNHSGFRPLSTFTFALNFALSGRHPASFHVVNIVLNAFAAYLVFVIVQMLFNNQNLKGDKRLAFITAILFMFLPIHTEAVASIKARDEILAAIFGILAWISFIKATYETKVNVQFLVGSVFLFVLALLSKELAIVMPLLFLFIYYVQRRPGLKKLVVIFAPFLLVYIFYYLWAGWLIFQGAFGNKDQFIINPIFGSPYLVRFWTSFKIAFIYIVKTVIPVNLSASYDYNQLTLVTNPFTSPETIAGILLLSALVAVVVNKKLRPTTVGIGAAIFLISYIVFSKFIVVGGQIMAERWMYFPSIGICILMGLAIDKTYLRNKVLSILVLASILISYSVVVVQRNRVWLSNQAFFESMVKTAPNSVVGHMNLAGKYLNNGDYEKAIPYIEETMRIYIDYKGIPMMLKQLALYYSEHNNSGREVVARGSGDTNNRLLALALAKDGKYDKSLEVLDKLVIDKPERQESPIVLFTYALDYFRLGKVGESEKYFTWVPGKTREDKVKYLTGF